MVAIHFRLGDYFLPGSHKVAISVPELVRETNQFSTKNRPGCDPRLTGSNPRDLFLHYKVTCHLPSSDPDGHDVRVHFDLSSVTDETSAKNLDVQASCSCPAFLYWGAQWNLHQRDALEGEPRPMLTAPTERLDLRNQFLICKHCKAVFERILPSVQHNITNIIRKRNVEQYKQRHKDDTPSVRPAPQKRRAPVRETPVPATPPNVVKRDAPATEEERRKTPVIDENKVPNPTPAGGDGGTGALDPLPVIDEFETPEEQPQKEQPQKEQPQKEQPQKEQPQKEQPQKEQPTEEPGEPPAPKDNNSREVRRAPHAPATQAPAPQTKLPRIRPQDREYMKRLQKEQQTRQQQDTQRRLRNNPAMRR